MTSRDKIINAIRKNKITDVTLPSLVFAKEKQLGLLHQFMQTIEAIGGSSVLVEANSLNELLAELSLKHLKVINAIPESEDYNVDEYAYCSAQALEDASVFYVEGAVAVGENGAVWVDEQQMKNRLLPFICQHLVIVVNEQNIVADMQEAYQQIHINHEGYGVFIAGPSKTADIEQSLVVGAHGPLSLQVLIIKNGK